jgi:hypothetical protein
MKRHRLNSEFLGFLAGSLLFLFIPASHNMNPNQTGFFEVSLMIGFGLTGAALGWFVGLVIHVGRHDEG